jgi:hypothetical protein
MPDSATPTSARDGVAGVAGAPKALTTRFLDFWLLGGASILVWLVMFGLDGFRASWAIDEHFRHLTVTTLSLSLLLNYPHFMASYKLAYTRERAFILGYWWQLIAVPALMVMLFSVAYIYYDVPVERLPLVSSARQTLSSWGANIQVLGGPRLGDLLFTLAFNLMILTLGWHYAKQVYGCMMVYARFDGYPLARAQRTLIRWALLSVWVMTVVDYNLTGAFRAWRGFNYSTFDLPDIAGPLSQLVVGLGFVLVLYLVFYTNYTVTKRRPSLTMLAPFLALYLWWLPLTRQEEYFFLLVPLFHAMQYLAFVYRMEDGQLRNVANREARGTLIVLGLLVSGWLAFEFVPDTIDTRLDTFDTWQMFFFFTAVMLFINIHHYFIDNVLWRFRDAQVRAHLLD